MSLENRMCKGGAVGDRVRRDLLITLCVRLGEPESAGVAEQDQQIAQKLDGHVLAHPTLAGPFRLAAGGIDAEDVALVALRHAEQQSLRHDRRAHVDRVFPVLPDLGERAPGCATQGDQGIMVAGDEDQPVVASGCDDVLIVLRCVRVLPQPPTGAGKAQQRLVREDDKQTLVGDSQLDGRRVGSTIDLDGPLLATAFEIEAGQPSLAVVADDGDARSIEDERGCGGSELRIGRLELVREGLGPDLSSASSVQAKERAGHGQGDRSAVLICGCRSRAAAVTPDGPIQCRGRRGPIHPKLRTILQLERSQDLALLLATLQEDRVAEGDRRAVSLPDGDRPQPSQLLGPLGGDLEVVKDAIAVVTAPLRGLGSRRL